MPPIVSTDRWQQKLLGDWFVRLSPVDSSPDILVKDFSVTRLAASDDIPRKDGKAVNKPVGLVLGGVILGRKSSQVKERIGSGGIASPILSRSHAHITISPSGHVYITDLRSLHGTSIVSAKEPSSSVVLKPFSPVQLCEQDTIVLGKKVNASNKSYAPVKFAVSFRYPELGQGSLDGEREYLGELSQEDVASKFLSTSKKFLAVKAIKSTDTWKKEMATSPDYSISPGASISGKSYREPNKYGIPEWMRYSSEEPELENIPMIAVGDEDDGIISVSSKSRVSQIRSDVLISDHQSVLSLSSDEDEWPRGSSNEVANGDRNEEADDNSFTDYDDLGSPEVFGVHEADHSEAAKDMHAENYDWGNHALQSQDDQSEHDCWSPSYQSSPVAWHFSPDLSDYDNEADEQQKSSDVAPFSTSAHDEAGALEDNNIGEANYNGEKVNNVSDETLPQEPPIRQTQADKLDSLDEEEQRESFYRAIAASFAEADAQGDAPQFDSEPLQLSYDNVIRLGPTNSSCQQPPASEFSVYGSEQGLFRNEKAASAKKRAELPYSYESEDEDEDDDEDDSNYDDDAASGEDDMIIVYSSEEEEDDLDDRSIGDEAVDASPTPFSPRPKKNSDCFIREKRPRQEVVPNKYLGDKFLTGKITMDVETTAAQEVITSSSSSEADSRDLPSSEGKKLDLHRDIEEEVAVFLEQSQQMLAAHAAVMNELSRQETTEACGLQPTSSPSSSSSSEGLVTPVIGRKRSLPLEFNEHEEPTIVEETSAVHLGPIEASNPTGPPAKRRNVASTVGLVVLGAALGSIGTIAGLMQLAE